MGGCQRRNWISFSAIASRRKAGVVLFELQSAELTGPTIIDLIVASAFLALGASLIRLEAVQLVTMTKDLQGNVVPILNFMIHLSGKDPRPKRTYDTISHCASF